MCPCSLDETSFSIGRVKQAYVKMCIREMKVEF